MSDFGIKLQLDAETIQRTMTQALIESAIGTRFKDVLNRALNDYSIQSAIDSVVKDVVTQMVRNEMNADSELRKRVVARFEALVTDEMLDKLLTTSIRYLKD